MDGDASMTKKVANEVKRRLVKARNSISNFIGIDDVSEDNYFQYIDQNDYPSTYTTVEGPNRHNGRSKPVKKKRSTSSLKSTRDSPLPKLSALTPIHKRGNSAATTAGNNDYNANGNRRSNDNGSFRSSIRKITHMSVTSSSRQSRSSANNDDDDDDSDIQPLAPTRETSTAIPLPTVEVQIPDTVIGPLGYQTIDGTDENHRIREPSPELPEPPTRPAASPPSYCEVIRVSPSKRSDGTRKPQKLLSSRTNSMSCDPSNKALIINRSRPNSRSNSACGCTEDHTIATRNPYDSDETLCNHRPSLGSRRNDDGECGSSRTVTADQSDENADAQGEVEAKSGAGNDTISIEEALRDLAIPENSTMKQSNDDRAFLPSQKGKALAVDTRRRVGPVTCRGALHSLSCEHLRKSFRSIGTSLAKTNKDNTTIPSEQQASETDKAVLENAESQINNLENSVGQNSGTPDTICSRTCDRQVHKFCMHHRTAVKCKQCSDKHNNDEAKKYSVQQTPTYDDWEDSPTRGPENYQRCDPSEFF